MNVRLSRHLEALAHWIKARISLRIALLNMATLRTGFILASRLRIPLVLLSLRSGPIAFGHFFKWTEFP